MLDSTSRTITTSAIWLAVAIGLASVFHISWNGDSALIALVFIVLILCGAATASTAFIWYKKPVPERRGFEPLPVSAHENQER